MPQRIVHLLEVVQVQEHQRQRPAAAAVARQRFRQAGLELPPVRQPRQRIDAAELVQLPLDLLERRDVGGQRVDAGHAAIGLHVGHVFGQQIPHHAVRFRARLEALPRAGQRRLQEGQPLLVQHRPDDLGQRPVQRLLRRHAHPGAEGRVEEPEPVLRVDVGDQHRQVVGDGAQPALDGFLAQQRVVQFQRARLHAQLQRGVQLGQRAVLVRLAVRQVVQRLRQHRRLAVAADGGQILLAEMTALRDRGGQLAQRPAHAPGQPPAQRHRQRQHQDRAQRDLAPQAVVVGQRHGHRLPHQHRPAQSWIRTVALAGHAHREVLDAAGLMVTQALPALRADRHLPALLVRGSQDHHPVLAQHQRVGLVGGHGRVDQLALDLARPAPAQVDAEHALQLPAPIQQRHREVDEAPGLVLARQQFFQQQRRMHVADEGLTAPRALPPRSLGDVHPVQQAASGRQHLALRVGHAQPREVVEANLHLVQRAAHSLGVVEAAEGLQLRQHPHFLELLRHAAVERVAEVHGHLPQRLHRAPLGVGAGEVLDQQRGDQQRRRHRGQHHRGEPAAERGPRATRRNETIVTAGGGGAARSSGRGRRRERLGMIVHHGVVSRAATGRNAG